MLRAFFYYLLTCTFGDVPYYTEEVTHENRPRIASLPRMSADDTRDSLIAELEHYLFPESLGGLEALELRRSYDGTSVSRLGAATYDCSEILPLEQTLGRGREGNRRA